MDEEAELDRSNSVRKRILPLLDDSLQSESDNSRDPHAQNEKAQHANCSKRRLSKSEQGSNETDDRSPETNSALHRVVWTDLIDQTRTKLVNHLDEQLEKSLAELVTRVEARERSLRGSQWHCDYMTDKRPINDSKSKKPLLDKVFCHRDSVLTVLFQISHIRTVYHMFIALLIIFSVNTIFVDLLDPKNSMFTYDLEFFKFAFGGFHEVVTCWIAMQLSTMFVPFIGFLLWCTKRPPTPKMIKFDWVALGFFALHQVLFIVLPIRFILRHQLPPASTAIVVMEQVRMFMKSHAFVRSSAEVLFEKQAERTALTDTKAPSTSSHKEAEQTPWFPDFSHYLYFLFAPTLIYRDSYPRTSSIRWAYVVTNLLQVAGCILLSYYVFVRFCFAEFVNFGQSTDYSLRQFILTSTATSLPGGLVMLLVFFASLHSWLNAFAEMLRFGDRLFYKDWWNSTTFSTWYRTWNVVVHDWLYIYLYKDLQRFAPNRSRPMATAAVFWLSAAVHEYALSLMLRFVYPVLFVFFAFAGYLFIYVKGSGRCWNVFIWVSLFTGWGQMMCLYSMEWYARKNCEPVFGSWVDIFVPHSWFCRPLNRSLTV